MLNWRRDPGYEKSIVMHEQRMKQLESDILRVRSDSERSKERTKLIEKETEQLRRENAREKALSASIRRLCFPPESSSTPQTPIEPGSKPFLPS
jgi:septal ring factor EnvC (AmiA/AmiB activator)